MKLLFPFELHYDYSLIKSIFCKLFKIKTFHYSSGLHSSYFRDSSGADCIGVCTNCFKTFIAKNIFAFSRDFCRSRLQTGSLPNRFVLADRSPPRRPAAPAPLRSNEARLFAHFYTHTLTSLLYADLSIPMIFCIELNNLNTYCVSSSNSLHSANSLFNFIANYSLFLSC